MGQSMNMVCFTKDINFSGTSSYNNYFDVNYLTGKMILSLGKLKGMTFSLS